MPDRSYFSLDNPLFEKLRASSRRPGRCAT